jgi:hypothetical protein
MKKKSVLLIFSRDVFSQDRHLSRLAAAVRADLAVGRPPETAPATPPEPARTRCRPLPA